MVSGCDERMRVMPDTEAHLFGWLDVKPQEFGGHMKKQISTADRFATDPYVDHGLKRVFFPRVGEKFAIKQIPASQLVMRLMNTLVSANRFSDTQDHAKTLKMLSEVASQVSTYDLTLSPDFRGLDLLYEFLASDE